MILFFAPGGRIGNLLFQLAFIESIRKPSEWLIATQLKGIHKKFSGFRRIVSTESRLFINIVDFLLYPLIIHVFVKTNIFSSYLENKKGELVYQKGLLPITLIGGYFQGPQYFDENKLKFRLRGHYYSRPNKLLSNIGSQKPIFVHIRRTDYANFKVDGNSEVMLPFGYYEKSLQFFKPFEHFHFFIVGDDPDWATEQFEFLPFKTISTLNPFEDLALMTLCEGGIISNSSFAWWGAFFSKKSLPIIAPLYWFGWKTQSWNPKTIFYEKYRYISVD